MTLTEAIAEIRRTADWHRDQKISGRLWLHIAPDALEVILNAVAAGELVPRIVGPKGET